MVIDRTLIASGPAAAADAARRLRSGQVVAVPTETVYGLAADATDEHAVASIFSVKGRPANNPLITHVLSTADARKLTCSWPTCAEILAKAFWPGPLTMVLPSADLVAKEVCAGLPTIGMRVPAHPVMRDILCRTGRPLAAPSANRSGHISPTTAEHVLADLDGRIELIVDGGPCAVGIESTVVGFQDEKPVIYRPGIITGEDIDMALQSAGWNALPTTIWQAGESQALPSPGMLSRHYAPRRPTFLFLRAGWPQLIKRFATGRRCGVICFGPLPEPVIDGEAITLPTDLYHAAGRLYAAMRQLDRPEIDVILIEMPNDGRLTVRAAEAACEPAAAHIAQLSGMARVLADRLFRAASPWPGGQS